MGLFSSSTEKSTLAQNPINPDITTQYGSGAEQDRYGSHFKLPPNTIDSGIDRLKAAAMTRGEGAEQDRYDAHLGIGEKGYNKLKQAAHYQGEGAEQDRYGSHFSKSFLQRDAVEVMHASASVAAKGQHANYHGLGYDGQQRARMLAGSLKSEQETYESRFSLDRDTVMAGAQKIKDGARDMLEKR